MVLELATVGFSFKHAYVSLNEGALINIGSILSNRVSPIQGAYSATKYALKEFTDGLRVELEKEGAAVSITQIYPYRIDTPYTDHATSYIDKHPTHRKIIYPPESVAEAILYATAHPVRDIYVGTWSKFYSLLAAIMPRFTDRYMGTLFYKTAYDPDRPSKPPHEGNLYEPKEEMNERGHSNIGWVRPKSLMVKAKKHPLLTKTIFAGTGLLLLKMCARKK